ncbi:MAG: insulinase family protein, partial [Planctomycetota bacterium]
AISASLTGFKHAGRLTCYAGTTTDRAQETLDRTLEELRGADDGVTDDELARVKARAKSALVMQQESTAARAGSLTRDWVHLGRVCPLEEVTAKIDALTPADIADHVRRYPADDLAIVTLGREPLTVSAG